MKKQNPLFLILAFAMTLACCSPSVGQIKSASANGFSVEAERVVDLTANKAYAAFVGDFNKWYDASHSYTTIAENLSLDLQQRCMLEKLPDGGFVRHMEIVFHQPGKLLRMTGGLGPLQGMGVTGALTYTFEEKEGKTAVKMTYNVVGADFMKLDAIAAPVNQVLIQQLDRFRDYCNE